MTLEDQVTRSADVLHREMQGETVLLHTERGVYLGLNEVGSRVWSLLGETGTLQEVRDRLIQEFDVEPETCEKDLLELVEKMASQGLVEIHA